MQVSTLIERKDACNVAQKIAKVLAQKLQPEQVKDLTNHLINLTLSNPDASGRSEIDQYGEFQLQDLDLEVICVDLQQFIQNATLVYNRMEHSWAGSNTTIEHGWNLLPVINEDFKFGRDYRYLYSLNGNVTEDLEEKLSPEFDAEEIQCILINHEVDNNFNSNYHTEDRWILIIYVPDSNIDQDYLLSSNQKEFMDWLRSAEK